MAGDRLCSKHTEPDQDGSIAHDERRSIQVSLDEAKPNSWDSEDAGESIIVCTHGANLGFPWLYARARIDRCAIRKSWKKPF